MERGEACSLSDPQGGNVLGINNILASQSHAPRERAGVPPPPHQLRWSAEFSKLGASPIIVVRKGRRQPQPPQRSSSLTHPATPPRFVFKRYSCPPIGSCRSASRLRLSSSSSSASSCSSPPPVPTSVITGPDPRGWKLRPHPRSRRVSRLSLQIPLPVVSPDPGSGPARDPDPAVGTEPPRRRHSEPSASLASPVTRDPAVTLEALRALRLKPVGLPRERNDVFREAEVGGAAEASGRPRRIPPPVPKKTLMARRKARMIALSQQSTKANDVRIYACVIKPKSGGRTELREDETHTGKIIPEVTNPINHFLL